MTITIRAIVVAVLVASLSWSSALAQPTGAPSSTPVAAIAAIVRPSVLVVTTFQYGDPAKPTSVGEAQRWVTRDHLTRRIAVDGLTFPVFCDAGGAECLLITGMGKVNAAASMLVAGMSGQLDLRRTYVLVAGIAGTSPDVASIGSAAWAQWIVDGGIAHEIDPREPYTSETFSRARLGCGGVPWCAHPWIAGTELAHLNGALRDWAYRESRSVTLHDSASVKAFRAHYRATRMGSHAPAVLACDIVSDDTYWQGAIMSRFAKWWMQRWTGGRGTYCMSVMEDSGIAAGVARLAARHRVDRERLLIVRAASDYDRPYAGESPAQSLRSIDTSGGLPLALENAYATGEVIVRKLLARGEAEQPAGVSSTTSSIAARRPSTQHVVSRPPSTAQVTMVVHVPLNDGDGAPIAPALLAQYALAFRKIGTVVDRPGIGSWVAPGSAHPEFEADDHVFIVTSVARARAFLPDFLQRMRGSLHQQATLAELFGGWYGSDEQRRVRIDAVVPLSCLCDAKIRAVHAILDRAGGASQYDALDGTHVYTSAKPTLVAAIEHDLRALRVVLREERSTFVLVHSDRKPREDGILSRAGNSRA